MKSCESISFPVFPNHWVSVPYGEKRAKSIRLLSQEFSHCKPEEFGDKLGALMNTFAEEIFVNPDQNLRCAELFVAENDTEDLVAVCVNKYYKWFIIGIITQ